MVKKCMVISLAVLVLMGISSRCLAVGNVTLAKKVTRPPKIDGKLNDKCWQRMTKETGFVDNVENKPVKEQTTVYIGYDETNLYLAFICKESQMDKIKKEAKERDKRVWADDSIEMFLDTDHDKHSYYWLVSNCAGLQEDADCTGGSRNRTWNPAWEVKTSLSKDSWILEAKIPFKVLKTQMPGSGTIWGVNFCREEQPRKEYSSWSYVAKGFHQPRMFGNLIFGSYNDELKTRLKDVNKRLDGARIKLEKEKKISAKGAIAKIEEKLNEISFSLKKEDITKEGWYRLDGEIAGTNQMITKLHLLGKQYVIWHKNPMIQLTPYDAPETGNDLKELNVSMYSNEYEGEAFILTNATDKSINLRVVVEPLIEKKTKMVIPPSCITLRTASFVKIRDGRIIGDPLPLINQAKEVILPPDEPRQVWLTIDTKHITPGAYEGAIIVKPHYGAREKKIKLNLSVYPVRLPDKLPLTAMAMSFFGAFDMQNVTWATIEGQIQDLLTHRFNAAWIPSWLIPPPVWKPSGDIIDPVDKISLKRFKGIIKLCKAKGVKKFFLCFPEAQIFLHSHSLDKEFGFMSPEYKKMFRIWFEALVRELKEMDLAYDDFPFCIKDEACGEYVDKTVRICRFIREEVDPEIKFFVDHGGRTTLDDMKKMSPYMDYWIPHNVWIENEEILTFLKSTGKPVYFYTCKSGSKRLSPLKYWRWHGHYAWKYGLTGCGFWGYDIFEGNPWDDFDKGPYADRGDPLVIYYNNTKWPESIITSRRWEAFREGLEDYTCLYLLNKAMEKAEERGIDVSKGKHLLNQFNYEVYYDKDPDTVYRFMDNVREETVRLNRLMPFTIKAPKIVVKGNNVTIHWESSQLCMGEVYYLMKRKKGEKRWAEVWSNKSSGFNPTTNHSVTLKNLAPEYKFLFYTSSVNESGYMVIDNNKGKFYQFETK